MVGRATPTRRPASTKTATEQRDSEFDAADAVLKDQIDNLVPQFKSANAAFVTDYQNARIRVDLVGAKPKPKKPTPPGP